MVYVYIYMQFDSHILCHIIRTMNMYYVHMYICTMYYVHMYNVLCTYVQRKCDET